MRTQERKRKGEQVEAGRWEGGHVKKGEGGKRIVYLAQGRKKKKREEC